MYRKIIIGYEDDEHAREALALTRALAAAGSVEVIIVNVVDRYRYVWETPLVEELTREVERQLTPVTEDWPPGVAVSTRALGGMSAPASIHRLAEAEDASLIVLGPTHRGTLGRAVLGTTAEQLLHGASCPVALAPPGYVQPELGLRTVAVAYDGSPEADAALDWAVDVAGALGAGLRLIAVVEPLPTPPTTGFPITPQLIDRSALVAATHARMEANVNGALAELPDELKAEASIWDGEPADELREASASGVDLLVVGSRGFGPLRTVLLGRVSAALARSCPVPAVFIPRRSTAAT